jgi:hypothetical protein
MLRWLALGTLLASTIMMSACGSGGSSGSCSPATCAGCCSNGTCKYDILQQGYCGTAGASCNTWLKCASGQQCDTTKGTCAEKCGDTCPGCCVANKCMPGTDLSYCGTGGGPCLTCTSDQKCVSGSCQGDTACGPGKCAGCCNGNQCMPGTDLNFCGKGGAPCAACTSPLSCVAGSCQSSTACSAVNCPNGCCYKGSCMPGDNSGLCGTGGVACVDCSSSGQVCDATKKQCVTGQCGPSGPGACAGCCDSTGKCALPGTNNTACGKAGVACQDCTKANQICGTAQTCTAQPPPPTCGPSNCNGCCDVKTGCVPSPVAPQCGTGGGACSTCAAGQECVNGTCKCTPSKCTGCCQGDNCMAGTSNPACGSGGAACVACTGTNTCSATTHTCQAASTCSSSNCGAGKCCSTSGSCVNGGLNGSCGTNGVKCADCTKTSQICMAPGYTCGTSSNCSSCAGVAGKCCSSSGTCVSGSSSTACGTNGAACSDCTSTIDPFPSMQCSSNTCQAVATTTWKVIVGWATFNKSWNIGWGKTMPDSQVTAWAGGQDNTSYVIYQDWQPTWDQQLISNVTAGDLMGKADPYYHQTGFGFHVEQVGTIWNDDVAQCFMSISTEALYAAQDGYYWCFYGCPESGSTNYWNSDMIEEVCFQFLPMY